MLKRSAINITANWAWHVVIVASGFLIPRCIAEAKGREILGVWDFGWSLMIFVGMLNMGATGAVNRYVSRYRTNKDWHSLNGAVTCCLAILCAGALIGLAAGIVLAKWTPGVLNLGDPALQIEARQTILWLAAACALQMPLAVYNSVITGCNRFEILNGIRIAKDVAALIAMLVALQSNASLSALALIVFIAEAAGGAAQIVASYRLCPELSLRLRFCSARMLRKVFTFGGKSMMRGLARSGLYHGSSLLVGAMLGPAVLATFGRQRNLIMQIMKFVKQSAQTFTSTAAELDAQSDRRGLRELLFQAGTTTFAVAIPLILGVIVMGDYVVHVWMGPDYIAQSTLVIFAVGHLLSIGQLGPYSVLEGMGRHGKPALVEIGIAGIGVAATWAFLRFGSPSPISAAACVSFSVALGAGIIIPAYACRILSIEYGEYIRRVMVDPIFAALPFAIVMVILKWVLPGPAMALAAAVVIGGPVLAVSYWTMLAPIELRQKVRLRCAALLSRGEIAYESRLAVPPPKDRQPEATSHR